MKIKEDFSDERVFDYWHNIVSHIRGNRTMLLFAQRQYLYEKFPEFNQIETIEDTNRPWDYDHIYPLSWVYRNHHINELVRNWVNTIGNYRALSYDDNRSENNRISPKQRLTQDNKQLDSFIQASDLEHWTKLDDGSSKIKQEETEKTNVFINAVIHRMCNIYEEWYSQYYEHD
ncbi:DUF1524 domain-containing protein [Parapedobacter sp. 2B3]|uniref:GmrSD restriction endonuclease domain-containing protein n=1 Tax=Parapedobacter sp. 2B3 TaxID=3342381 RepID=UPI0035B5B838